MASSPEGASTAAVPAKGSSSKDGSATAPAPERTWDEVRTELEKRGTLASMQACIDESRPRKDSPGVWQHFFIQPDGRVQHVRKQQDAALDGCFERAVKGLRFPPARNKMAVAFEWGADRKKVRKFYGETVEPLDCEREHYPCSGAEADPERQKLAMQYLDELGKRIDCKDPAPAIAWLEKQPHIQSVEHQHCTVFFIVEHAEPVWFKAHDAPGTR